MPQNTEQSPRRSRTEQYSDFDLNFTANRNTGDIAIRSDLDAIRQSLLNILTTNRGEKPFEPLFGTNLYRYPLFENFSSLIEAGIRQDIRYAITNWEPRVRIDDIRLEPVPQSHRLKITLHYTVVSPEEIQDSLEHVVERIR